MQKLTPVGTSRLTFEGFTFIYFVECTGGTLAYFDNDTGTYVYDQWHYGYKITNIIGNSMDMYFNYSGAVTLNYNVIGY